jgi:hypothetical protein
MKLDFVPCAQHRRCTLEIPTSYESFGTYGGLFYLRLEEGILSPGEQPSAQQWNWQLCDRFQASCHTKPGTMIFNAGVLGRGAQNPRTILVGWNQLRLPSHRPLILQHPMILPGGIQNPGDPRAGEQPLRRPISRSRAVVPGGKYTVRKNALHVAGA